jgi:hypothetical protein
VQLVGDMPIYVGGQSADVWAHQKLFELGPDGAPQTVSGVPPDAFSDTGQLWGSPLYDWGVRTPALRVGGWRVMRSRCFDEQQMRMTSSSRRAQCAAQVDRMPGLVIGPTMSKTVPSPRFYSSRNRPPRVLARPLLAGAEGGRLPVVGAAHQPLAGAVRRDAHRPLPGVCGRARSKVRLAALPNLPGLMSSCAQSFALLVVPVTQ